MFEESSNDEEDIGDEMDTDDLEEHNQVIQNQLPQEEGQRQEPQCTESQIQEESRRQEPLCSEAQNQVESQRQEHHCSESQSQEETQRQVSVDVFNPIENYIMKKVKQNPEFSIPPPSENRGKKCK